MVSASLLSHYKSGRKQPPLKTAKMLADHYNCTLDYLYKCLELHTLPGRPDAPAKYEVIYTKKKPPMPKDAPTARNYKTVAEYMSAVDEWESCTGLTYTDYDYANRE